MLPSNGTGGALAGGSTSTGGSSAGNASGGAGGSSSSGGASAAGMGGTPITTGGSASGGESATGGAGGAGAGQANATGGAPAGGQAATGGGAPLETTLIDDLEDGDARILVADGRQGPWHTFNPNGNGALMPEKGGANGSMFAAHTSGMGFDYAGMGFDLNNSETTPESMQSKPFDASRFSGVVFMIKGGASDSVRLRFEIPTRNFVPTDRGGTCSSDCWNVYGWEMPMPRPTSTWQEVKVPFGALTRDNGSKEPPFDRTQLMSISFKQVENAKFDFWIDDVRFYE